MKSLAWVSAFLIVSFSVPPPTSTRADSREEALRVLGLIEKIQEEQSVRRTGAPGTAVVTESELNSYIRYRIETEKEPVLKELGLRLFDKNRIEGKIGLDFSGQKLPSFLNPRLNFYFDATLVAREGRARLDIRRLFLEDQPVQAALLDLAISIAARLSNSKSSSLGDWYDLPFGLRSLETQRGRLIVTY